VMIDGVMGAGADGKPVWKPRSAEELARISSLVRSAIGFDEKRGDHVDVVSMRFAQEDAGTVADRPGILGIPIEKADLLHLAETAVFGLIGLLALLLVLRPMVLRLTTLQPMLPAPGAGAEAPFMALPDGSGGGTPGLIMPAPFMAGLPGQAAAMAMLEDESMVNLAQIEGQIRASSLRKISDLADKHPEETLSIVRGWMAREAD
jgi:flagellar M-ring protein FliF